VRRAGHHQRRRGLRAPGDGQPLEHAQTTLFQQADEALYRAKQAGRDRVALYGTDVQAEPPPEAAQHG